MKLFLTINDVQTILTRIGLRKSQAPGRRTMKLFLTINDVQTILTRIGCDVERDITNKYLNIRYHGVSMGRVTFSSTEDFHLKLYGEYRYRSDPLDLKDCDMIRYRFNVAVSTGYVPSLHDWLIVVRDAKNAQAAELRIRVRNRERLESVFPKKRSKLVPKNIRSFLGEVVDDDVRCDT